MVASVWRSAPMASSIIFWGVKGRKVTEQGPGRSIGGV